MSKIQEMLLRAIVASLVIGPGVAWGAEETVPPTIIYIVRHAEKKTGDELSEMEKSEDTEVDLSPDGYVRAEILAWMLRSVDLDAVYSTKHPTSKKNFKRTLMTVTPSAEQANLSVQFYLAGEEAKLARQIKAIGKQGKTVLVCGHSNTIPALLCALGAKFRDEHIEEKEYDNLFIVVLNRDSQGAVTTTSELHLRYPGV